MTSDSSAFSVYSIHGLPTGVCGESYVVIAAFESLQNVLATEFFIMTKRPKESLSQGTQNIQVCQIPPELGKIDIDFALQEGKLQAELALMSLLESRATELSRPDIASLQFELQQVSKGRLLSCWMRGIFKTQLKEVYTVTRCRSLARYLELLSNVTITSHVG